jgi:hypothetical protein
MATPRPWIVTPHQPLQKLESNLWVVDGRLPSGNLTRVMMIAKLSDGRLLFYNAIPLEEPLMKEVEAWGTPAYLVVPNGFHRLDIHAFKQRYPAIKVVASKPDAAKISKVLAVELTTDQLPKDRDVELITLRGTKVEEPALLVRSGASSSLAFADSLFNLKHVPGFDGFLMKLIGSVGGPRVTLLARLAIVGDKKALADHFRELSKLPGLKRLIPSHGSIIDTDAAGVLNQVADRL